MELSVIDEREQARISLIRDEATESVLESAAKHLSALATLLLRAKAKLGFPDATPTSADLRRAAGEAEDIVADLTGHWPLSPTDAVHAADPDDFLGGNSEYTIDAVASGCCSALEAISKRLGAE